MIKLAIHGAGGRIGRLLLELAGLDRRFQLVGALVRPGSSLVGQPAPGTQLIYGSRWPEQLDVVIDFSLPDAWPELLGEVSGRGCALVSGTTGLSPEQRQSLDVLAQTHAVLWASNFSLGAAVLAQLAAQARRWLPESFEAAIFEAHHSAKRDAPSGTALSIAAAVAAAADGPAPVCSSLRAGRIVGEHTVYFAGPGERIELVHRAEDRGLFAHGALAAAAWIQARAPGRYQITDLLRAD